MRKRNIRKEEILWWSGEKVPGEGMLGARKPEFLLNYSVKPIIILVAIALISIII